MVVAESPPGISPSRRLTVKFRRSVINQHIDLAIEVFAGLGFHLPPFAFWTVDEWQSKGPEADEIRDCMLGWDVTDFGLGDFSRVGRVLFTLRNGNAGDPAYAKPYGEKLILNPPLQRAPAHFHRRKMEDICNRGGGQILVQVWAADGEGRRSTDSLSIQVDGQTQSVAAGGVIYLQPGESVCLTPGTVHQFWGAEDQGVVVTGEISSVCDDQHDNNFLEAALRFPVLDEDQPRRYYLCHEYPEAANSQGPAERRAE